MLIKFTKRIMLLSLIITFLFTINVNAMHIMDGSLPPIWTISWSVICIPFLVIAYIRLKNKLEQSQKNLVLLALCGAFAFVLSALKIPSITGSCSHPTGVGLGAILFGPFSMSIISVIVLLFQAILLAHGGITTLGANTFSMGIAGPILSFLAFKLSKKAGISTSISVFLAAFLGDLGTYIVTSVQLALAHPEGGSIIASLCKFLSIFALTQIPLAICEGLITVVIFGVLEKYNKKQLLQLGI